MWAECWTLSNAQACGIAVFYRANATVKERETLVTLSAVFWYKRRMAGPAMNLNSLISRTTHGSLHSKNFWFRVSKRNTITPNPYRGFSISSLVESFRKGSYIRGGGCFVRCCSRAGSDSIVNLSIVAIQFVAPGASVGRDKRPHSAGHETMGKVVNNFIPPSPHDIRADQIAHPLTILPLSARISCSLATRGTRNLLTERCSAQMYWTASS